MLRDDMMKGVYLRDYCLSVVLPFPLPNIIEND